MAKESGDITRIVLNVYNLENSETIMRFSDAELGQWLRLFCKAVSIAKECSLPNDKKLLQNFVKSNLSERVLEAFPVIDGGPLTGRRRNDVQYAAWLRLKDRSEMASLAASARYEPDPHISPSKQYTETLRTQCERSCERTANALLTIHNNTIHNITEENSNSIGQLCDEVLASVCPKQTIAGTDINGRKRGEPGYFERGQYPGTDPKKIFKYLQIKWCEIKGEAAHARYPSKYPEPWKELCDSKQADLIVPAFELWCQKHGRYMTTAWPVSEFLRCAEEFMALVMPLNEAVPKTTQSEIDAAYARAKKGHEDTWGSATETTAVTEPKVQVEPDPASMFEEEPK